MNRPEHNTDRCDFVPFPKAEIEQSIPDRFASQVGCYPDRLAVRSKGVAFSYRDLNTESNQIANAIVEICGAVEEPVVLLMEQGAPLVAGILGALKAGKIYVPQNATSARATIQRVLEACVPRLIITDSPNLTLAQELDGDNRPILNIDVLGENLALKGPRLNLHPDRPASIFYTSGSTGAPKGVVDSHRNILHNVMRYTNNLAIGSHDRLSLVQSCSFSGSVSNIFCALLNGAAVFPFDLRRAGPSELATWVNRERLTIFHSVPLIFEQLLSTEKDFPSLRTVRLEGDAATTKHVRLFQRYFTDNCRLVNGLGTTETGLVRQFFIDKDTAIPGPAVPIGYPIEDMEVILLDENGKQLYDDEVGEIAVRSRYLALGYWRCPELTEAAFLRGDVGTELRTYRTGDMGAMGPDGCLTYLGRKDFQIKVRGQHVDITAIEDALSGIDVIRDAVVTARQGASGVKQVVAYLVVEKERQLDVSRLRGDLLEQFEPYAIPARYVVLDELPVDENGKVRRRDLPAPGDQRPPLRQKFIAPRTPLEKTLARYFEKLLLINKIGVNDDFFDLGGDSLKAVELALMIERKLAARVPSDLFLGGFTVANLSNRINQDVRTPNVVALKMEGTGESLFLFHDYNGHVLMYRNLVQKLSTDRPVYGIQFNGEPSGYVVSARLEDLASHYAQQIRQIQASGPYLLGGQCFGGVLAFATAHRLRALGEEISCLVMVDTAFPGSGIERSADYYSPRRHWHWISNLTSRAAFAKLGVRLRNLGRFMIAVVWHSTINFTGYAQRLSEARIPRFLQRPTDVHRIAEAKYAAPAYYDKILLICAGTRPNHRRWETVATGGLEIVSLPEAPESDAETQLTDPIHIEELALAIDSLLE